MKVTKIQLSREANKIASILIDMWPFKPLRVVKGKNVTTFKYDGVYKTLSNVYDDLNGGEFFSYNDLLAVADETLKYDSFTRTRTPVTQERWSKFYKDNKFMVIEEQMMPRASDEDKQLFAKEFGEFANGKFRVYVAIWVSSRNEKLLNGVGINQDNFLDTDSQSFKERFNKAMESPETAKLDYGWSGTDDNGETSSAGMCTVDIDVANKKIKISDYKIKHFSNKASIISEIVKEANWTKKQSMAEVILTDKDVERLIGKSTGYLASDISKIEKKLQSDNAKVFVPFVNTKGSKIRLVIREEAVDKLVKTYKLEGTINKNASIKTASENNLTAEQQEKVNAELDNSTVSFQELAHQMSPIVKASVNDIYQYLLNEKSYFQYKHRIQ